MKPDPKTIQLGISIIHDEWDNALGTAFKLRAKNKTIKHILDEVSLILIEQIPDDKACSTIIAVK